ncbi:hypothetical protein HPB50_003731 [Hyalomma asiaticum]|uniref:Uncharacterized protein n=1 Tax=Hyalomma asiaticum TaxID=266040 RepID=A0ACB7SER8_HYAAI|nr:hypothetical protein HPB50_003731 [Hyalomma asiaticum]
MKISAIGSAIILLACVTCNYGQVDMAKGLALMQKAMSCFGNVDLTKMMQMSGNNGDIGKLTQNCLTGVMKSATTQ